MPRTFVLLVEALGVQPMASLKSPRQGCFVFGNTQDMYMIGHETVSQNVQPEMARIEPQQLQIQLVIFDFEKDVAAADTTLSDVMRNTGTNNPGQSWH